MGIAQSKQAEVDVPRKSQNRLSKPRTITSIPNAPSAASRRDSLPVVQLAVLDNRQAFPLDNSVAEIGTRSRRSSLSTRQRLREHLFRSKSSDGRSRTASVATREEIARDDAVQVGRWPRFGMPHGQSQGDENLPDLDRQPSSRPTSRPTSRRSSTAYTPYSHHASRLSLVIEANTPEPNMNEASQRLEQLAQRAHTERSNSDASMIPIRRRSLLMTPGAATRRDSNGELLYESFPVSRRLSAAGTLPSRRNSWFDQLNPDTSYPAELPAVALLTVSPVHYTDPPRTVTPSDQEAFTLGAFKLGTLRITNADSHNQDEDGLGLSIKVPEKICQPQMGITDGESPSKILELAQNYQQDLDSLSPFSFQYSRSSSPQLQTTSKNTAIEDELFEEDLEIMAGSREHALKILDGTDCPSPKPEVKRLQTAPVRVHNSYGSLDIAVQLSQETSYKPLTKNDSGYSSNVSLRSFKAKAEARAAAAAAAKSNDEEGSKDHTKCKSEASQLSNNEELSVPLKSHPVTLAAINAPPPLPEKSTEQKIAAATSQAQAAESNKLRSFRPSLTINRKPSTSSPVDRSNSSLSTMSPSSLIRRLTKGRSSSQPIIAVTSNREVDCNLIPPVSASASAKLEERQKDCPALSHTYKSTSRTNSMETLTTILSMPETADITAKQHNSHVGGSAISPLYLDHTSYPNSSNTSAKVPGERTKTKSLQRPTSKEHQVQSDFETHITSFGTVSHSLGASPYDLAVSAMSPHKGTHSFQNLAPDRLSNSNRSRSAHDTAPHRISPTSPNVHRGMDASTASRLARERSRDREIGRRTSAEKVRDDRISLPSNRTAIRASMTPTSSPLNSPHTERRNTPIPKPSRTPPQPPVTMSAYRKSHFPQSPQAPPTSSMGSRSISLQGPAASAKSAIYPQPGPWTPIPQHPHVMHRQSSNDVLNGRYKNYTRRPSFENSRQPPEWDQNPPFNNPSNSSLSYTNNNANSNNTASLQVMDRYSGGLAYEYRAGYEFGASAGMRNKWTIGNRRRSIDTESAIHYGIDFTDVPLMGQSIRQEA